MNKEANTVETIKEALMATRQQMGMEQTDVPLECFVKDLAADSIYSEQFIRDGLMLDVAIEALEGSPFEAVLGNLADHGRCIIIHLGGNVAKAIPINNHSSDSMWSRVYGAFEVEQAYPQEVLDMEGSIGEDK